MAAGSSDSDDLAPLKRTLGDLLASYRDAAGLTQKELARRIGYARVTVGTAESGHRQPAAEFWTRCEDVLAAGGELTQAYQQLSAVRTRRRRELARRVQAERTARAGAWRPHPPSDHHGATTADDSSGSDVGPGGRRPPGALRLPGTELERYTGSPHAPVEEVVDYLRQQWHVLVRADNLLGPVHALAAVLAQARLIEQLLQMGTSGGGGDLQAQLLRLGAQYAESAAWLYEDIGELATAVVWTSRALEWAHAAEDQAMVSWALYRRSQQSAAHRDVTRTLALARAAGRDPERLPAPMRSAILQQHAHGLALAGDEVGSLTRLDEALDYAAPADAAGDATHGHGSFCTAGYLQMQRASCWLLLGRPERAVPGYDQALAGLPLAYHRDRGQGLAQLGRALAATGEVERAAAVSAEALAIGAGAGSGRIVTEVRRTARELTAYATVPAVAALTTALSQVGPVA